MAKRLLKRVKLFEDIKEAISDPNLNDRLRGASKAPPAAWWVTPLHDHYLLNYVLSYGIGTKEWATIVESKDSVFYLNEDNQHKYKKQKEYFMREFTKDKSDLIKRLEYLCLLVLDPEAGHKRKDKYGSSFRAGVYTRAYSEEKKRRKEDEVIPLESIDLATKMKLNLNSKISTRDVERDSNGKPILPFMAKGATIINLGTIVYDRPSFYSKNYIWPVGFKSSRKLPSMKNTNEYVTYISEIQDGGSSPIFTVTPQDDPSKILSHSTSSGVWCETLKLIKKRPNISVSGPEMFGFSDSTVKMLIQELPNARKCTQYAWKDFDTVAGESSPLQIDTDFEKEEKGSDNSAPHTPNTIPPTSNPIINHTEQPSESDETPYNSPPSSPDHEDNQTPSNFDITTTKENTQRNHQDTTESEEENEKENEMIYDNHEINSSTKNNSEDDN